MNQDLAVFLDKLYRDGLAYDAAQAHRLLKRRNLEPATAELLSFLVRIVGARHVIEIGTANGYSTVCLADAVADTGGRIVSVDVMASDEARANVIHADAIRPGVAERVAFQQLDGGAHLAQLADGSVDLLFLDAERSEYAHWWPHPVRVLRPGGVLAIDNVRSHAEEVAPFLTLLAHDASLVTTTLAVGKGLSLTWKRISSEGLPAIPAG